MIRYERATTTAGEKIMSRFVLALMTLVLVQHANASQVDTVLNLNGAGIGGTGCVNGKASVKLTAGDILQIRTPGLANAGSRLSPVSRKACSIAIPYKLKFNEKLVFTAGRVNVAMNLKRGAVARTNAEVFAVGTLGARASAVDNGPKNQLSLLKIGSASTACGRDGILRANLSQVLTAKSSRSRSRINGAVLRLKVVKCN